MVETSKLKERIFISGAGGMLGEGFYQVFRNDYDLFCTDIDVNETWLSYLDFREFNEYRRQVIEFQPKYLFHLGAFTDLEYCELHSDEAYRTNTLSVEHAIAIANELDIPLVYISTAGIFDGTMELYDDWDVPNPIGVYGKTKYLGELIVQQLSRKFFVCRAGWMMGGGPKKDKKFVSKIIEQIRLGSTELFIVDDKDGTPTYTHDFAKNVMKLIRTPFYGVYNMVCGGQTSRMEVAEELLSVLNLRDRVRITAVKSDFFAQTYFAKRPPSERLINRKLALRSMNVMRDWKIALKEYIETYYEGHLSELPRLKKS